MFQKEDVRVPIHRRVRAPNAHRAYIGWSQELGRPALPWWPGGTAAFQAQAGSWHYAMGRDFYADF